MDVSARLFRWGEYRFKLNSEGAWFVLMWVKGKDGFPGWHWVEVAYEQTPEELWVRA